MSTTYFDSMFESSNYGLDLDLDYFNDYNDYFLENEYDKYNDYNYLNEIDIMKTDMEVNDRIVAQVLNGAYFIKCLNFFKSKEERTDLKRKDYDKVIAGLENTIKAIDVDLAKLKNGESLDGQRAKTALYKLVKMATRAVIHMAFMFGTGTLAIAPDSVIDTIHDMRDLYLTVTDYKKSLITYKKILLRLLRQVKRRKEELKDEFLFHFKDMR